MGVNAEGSLHVGPQLPRGLMGSLVTHCSICPASWPGGFCLYLLPKHKHTGVYTCATPAIVSPGHLNSGPDAYGVSILPTGPSPQF